MRLVSIFKYLWNDSQGATAVEYGFLVSLIVIAIIAAIAGVGGETGRIWNTIHEKSAKAMGGA